MKHEFLEEKQRQRASSQRALQTRERIMDAAEQEFARNGYDGASIRSIAAEAEVPVALVNHHGGGKEALFWRVVARRAEDLSTARQEALSTQDAKGNSSVPELLRCFIAPLLERADHGGAQWLAYARLVAYVSADPRWEDLAAVCFDPTAQVFVDRIAAHYPTHARAAVASGFIYSIAAMLALLTSQWRMTALGDGRIETSHRLDELVAFCASGIDGCAAQKSDLGH
ncbi:TetR/AcrR family transcriptional regulator [Shimia sp.]|uniref:TetR/AcrR family transcriptional regulator n=1 Tax=Shimia sp. TaxID=1954381 RepID=UPI003B8B623F